MDKGSRCMERLRSYFVSYFFMDRCIGAVGSCKMGFNCLDFKQPMEKVPRLNHHSNQ